MKTYKITGHTNSWIAQRDATFKGKTEIVIEEGLSLREAQKTLLAMYNKDYEDERTYCNNWGLAVIQSNRYGVGAYNTCGSRCYEYDSRVYTIEEDEE